MNFRNDQGIVDAVRRAKTHVASVRMTAILWAVLAVCVLAFGKMSLAAPTKNYAQASTTSEKSVEGATTTPETAVAVNSVDTSTPGVFSRAWDAGFVGFMTLLRLIFSSIASWVIIVTKWKDIGKINSSNDAFVKSFWESRSLNDLNSRLPDYQYSPAREVFRSGYAELARSNQMRDQTASSEIAIGAAMDNLNRTLQKAKLNERKRLEHNIHWLANIASVAPFVGLFGTVWGIMNSFEGIARSGSASLAAVAPGIAEALISGLS